MEPKRIAYPLRHVVIAACAALCLLAGCWFPGRSGECAEDDDCPYIDLVCHDHMCWYPYELADLDATEQQEQRDEGFLDTGSFMDLGR